MAAPGFRSRFEVYSMAYPAFHNLIGGEWLPALSGKTILNLNPADQIGRAHV